MSEDDAPESEQESAADSTDTRAPERPAHRHRRRWPWVLAGALLTPVVLFVAWIQITLHYTYSKGTRAGYVQKFSEKGWLCKTWEGELAQVNVPGSMPRIWYFTVRDDSVAKIIESSEGRQVQLSYAEHRGIPTSCYGDTQYFVTGVRVLGQ
jgi:hypothetical protein